jgi:hypothetical protein
MKKRFGFSAVANPCSGNKAHAPREYIQAAKFFEEMMESGWTPENKGYVERWEMLN